MYITYLIHEDISETYYITLVYRYRYMNDLFFFFLLSLSSNHG